MRRHDLSIPATHGRRKQSVALVALRESQEVWRAHHEAMPASPLQGSTTRTAHFLPTLSLEPRLASARQRRRERLGLRRISLLPLSMKCTNCPATLGHLTIQRTVSLAPVAPCPQPRAHAGHHARTIIPVRLIRQVYMVVRLRHLYPLALVCQRSSPSRSARASQVVFLLRAGFSKAVSHHMPLTQELGGQVAAAVARMEGEVSRTSDPLAERRPSAEKELAAFQGDVERWLSHLAEPHLGCPRHSDCRIGLASSVPKK